ncbi:ABC transporter permease [Sediminispirochaeta bajacaliforniensis]|uniref:ABC transporter permease n=1 Tax=Sediminispirochaeta bajacaliforniensis TaxID=148 RepID=UPI000361D5E7|nr:ABC transporter permease [Sediminispirochaeta bajacaliforniensis]
MKRFMKTHEFHVLVVILILSAAITVVNPNFLTLENGFDLLKSYSFMGVLAIGILFVLISGGIDISFAATATVAEYVMAVVSIKLGGNMITSLLLATLVGLLLGAFNGFLISKFKIAPIITTIATMNFYYGILTVITGGKWIYALPEWFRAFADIRVFTLVSRAGTPYGLSVITLFWAVITVLAFFLLRYTILGRGIYAIGGDIGSAERVGFPVRRLQIFVYSFMGMMAGIAGVIQALLVQTVAPNSIVGKELDVIAAVVLGGASLSGGFGSVGGTLLGVFLIAVVKNGMTLVKIPAVWYDVFIGAVILISVGFTSWQGKKGYHQAVIDIEKEEAA